MPDVPNGPGQVEEVLHERLKFQMSRHALYREIEGAIKGELPRKYEHLFDDSEFRIEFRTIQLAAQDLTALTKKVFPIEVAPTGMSEQAKRNDERVEKIAWGWNEGARNLGGDDMSFLMGELARQQVLFADGCLMILPDFKTKTLYFHVTDAATHFPPVGWNPLSIVPLDNTMIATQEMLGNVMLKYPDKAGQLSSEFERSTYGYGGGRRPDANQPVRMVQFYGSDAWYVCVLGGKRPVVLLATERDDADHPGVCPVSSARQVGFDPLFAGQLGLEVALQKVLVQEIEATDQMLHGPVAGPQLVGGDLKWDSYNIIDPNVPGNSGQLQRLAPTSPLNTQRMTAELMNMLRIANRNPESFQGAGDANSAKAVQTLQSGIRSTVQDILWPPIMNALNRAYEKGRQMELNLWPNERKKILGRTNHNRYVEVDYTSSVHLANYKARIKVESDGELGGYQGTLDRLQKQGAKNLSRQTAMERDPDIRDVHEEIRRIEMESIQELIDQVVAAKGPALSLSGLIRVQELIGKGKTKTEAFQQAENEGVLEPPPPEVPEGIPGVPPELMAAMSGGEEQLALPPAGVL